MVNDEVLGARVDNKGHIVGDIPGAHFEAVKVTKISLLALCKGEKERSRS